MINTSAGVIQGKYHHSTEANPPCAIILHPLPQGGGTMNSKVAYKLYQSFARNKFSVLRFNFRSVDPAYRDTEHGVGELHDASVALDWIREKNINSSSFWVGGFSFGASIGMQLLMRRPEIKGFISIAPPVGNSKYDFNFLSPCPIGGLIVQGENDTIVSHEDVTAFVNKLTKQKGSEIEYSMIMKADHFFRNHLDELETILCDYIARRKEEDAKKPKQIKTDRRRRPASHG